MPKAHYSYYFVETCILILTNILCLNLIMTQLLRMCSVVLLFHVVHPRKDGVSKFI